MTPTPIPPPDATRQARFHQFLLAARDGFLIDALRSTLIHVDPLALKEELARHVPIRSQQILAGAGIRDEHVFPTPIVLRSAPKLVAYYRLLLGAPQKIFYRTGAGMTLFRSMETRGVVGPRQIERLPDFCDSMAVALADLIDLISPTISDQDVRELPLITLGAQLQGGNNNLIGRVATAGVFDRIIEIVQHQVTSRTPNSIALTNAAGRPVRIVLGADPDISVQELSGTTFRMKVAIEIKGGTDRSNAHNRAGEAEKSHLKAKALDFRDFWTIISLHGVDAAILSRDSPTTTSWFDVGEVLAGRRADFDEFRRQLVEAVGIP